MSAEFVSMKEDRDDTILSLKLEVQELKGEIKELRQQHIAHTSVLGTGGLCRNNYWHNLVVENLEHNLASFRR